MLAQHMWSKGYLYMHNVCIYHSFMQRPVHPSFGRVKPILDWLTCGWTDGGRVKVQRSKKFKIFKNHRYCQLSLRNERK